MYYRFALGAALLVVTCIGVAPAGAAETASSGGAPAPLTCPDGDTDCAYRAAKASPVGSTAFWKPDFSTPLESRVQAAPPEMVRYLTFSNTFQGFKQRPAAAEVTADIRRDFNLAIGELPVSVKALVKDRLIGIFLVTGLGSTGYTDVASASSGYLQSGFIVIDTGVFTGRRANSWATWKENTPFSPALADRLDAHIEEGKGDSRAHAIQYILLHELGHVASIRRHLHPNWTEPIANDHELNDYAFARQSWQVSADGKHYQSRFDAIFPMRQLVVFYLGARIDRGDAGAVYQQLHGTNYATLYGATNIYDDFAESFVNYVHVVLLKRPFEIRISHRGKTVLDYHACWSEARCAKKRALIEALLRDGL